MYDTRAMSRYKASLDICNKVYKWLFIFLFAVALGDVIYTLYESLVLALQINIARLFCTLVSGIIICPAALAAMIYSGYRRIDMYSYFSPAIAFLSLLLEKACDVPTSIFTVTTISAVIVSAAPTILTNSRYRFLEDQEGFPHFSPLLIEQQDKSREFRLNDPYEEAARHRKLTASDSMGDLELSGETVSKKIEEKNDYMDEI